MRMPYRLCDAAAAREPRVRAEAQVREDAISDGVPDTIAHALSYACADELSVVDADEAAHQSTVVSSEQSSHSLAHQGTDQGTDQGADCIPVDFSDHLSDS